MRLDNFHPLQEFKSTESTRRRSFVFNIGAGKLLSTILIVGLATSLLTGLSVFPARGQPVGLVCLAPSAADACPAPPVTISASVGSQLMVAVLIQGSDSFNGFDITLFANRTSLVPSGVNLGGSLLVGGSIIVECLGGVPMAGPSCSPTDTSQTLHLAVQGPPGFLTISPTSGLLFTAVYNVTSSASDSIGYQIGCSPSSVSTTSTCVLFTTGSLYTPSETAQGASYTQSPTPTFTMGSNIGSIDVSKGESGNVTIVLASVNGFSGVVSLSTGLTPKVRHPPNISLSSNSVTLSTGGLSTLELSASAQNNTDKVTYSIIVTGTASSQNGSLSVELRVVS